MKRCLCLSGRVSFVRRYLVGTSPGQCVCSQEQGRKMPGHAPSPTFTRHTDNTGASHPSPQSQGASTLRPRFLVALATQTQRIRCGLRRMAREHGETPRLLTWSPRIWGLFTTSFTRCSTVSVCRVLSAHIRSTRVSWNTLASGTICQKRQRRQKSDARKVFCKSCPGEGGFFNLLNI